MIACAGWIFMLLCALPQVGCADSHKNKEATKETTIAYNHSKTIRTQLKQSPDTSKSRQEQITTIEGKIATLKRWQEGYKMTAQRANFKADRLQFKEGNLVDSRRYWKVAADAKQKAQDLQVLIDKLEDDKRTILKDHD